MGGFPKLELQSSERPASRADTVYSQVAQDEETGQLASLDGSSVEPLRDAIQSLSYALHGLSHDIKEPIRMVACYSEMLANSQAVQNDPNLSEYVHFIAGAAQRIDAVVSRMLDYSRLLGQAPQQAMQVDMNAVVQTALANLQLKIEESSATVICDSLPYVLGDQVQLVELVQNLLANSIKYRSAAAPQIHIRFERLDQECLFSIEDNGTGIERTYHDSIFAPFKRLHGAELPGVGLGLAICRQIIQLHQGRIWVESAPGRGSIFQFVLPAWIS